MRNRHIFLTVWMFTALVWSVADDMGPWSWWNLFEPFVYLIGFLLAITVFAVIYEAVDRPRGHRLDLWRAIWYEIGPVRKH